MSVAIGEVGKQSFRWLEEMVCTLAYTLIGIAALAFRTLALWGKRWVGRVPVEQIRLRNASSWVLNRSDFPWSEINHTNGLAARSM